MGHSAYRPSRTVYLCAFLRAFATFSFAISQIPRLRLLESNVCRTYFRAHEPAAIDSITDTVPEERCKDSQVQAELASLIGWSVLFANIPVLIIGLVYTFLSSRVNRQVLLTVNVACNIFAMIYFYSICFFYNTFDIRLIWLTSLFDLIGGGQVVFDTLTTAMFAEAVPSESLSSAFFYLSSILTALRMVGVSGGSLMLRNGYLLPIGIGIGVWCMNLPTAISLRTGRTEGYKSIPSSELEEHQLDYVVNKTDEPPDLCLGSGAARDKHSISRQQNDERRHNDCREFRTMLSGYCYKFIRPVFKEAYAYSLPLFLFLTHEVAMGVRDVTEQWISKRYSLKLQSVGYILAGQTLLSAIILSALPKISRFCVLKRKLIPGKRDVFMASASVFAAAVGSLLIALSWTVPLLLISLTVFAFGIGFHDAMKSYVALCVGAENTIEITRMYMLISILEVLANMVNGPLWAATFTVALRSGEYGMSLPFLICSFVFLVTCFLAKRLPT